MSATPNSPPAAHSAESIDTLRIRHEVRSLSTEEEGSHFRSLPLGVYGFATAPAMDTFPLFAKKTYHSFEVHRAADGVDYLIGFVSEPEAAALASRKEGAAVRLFPDPWQTSQHLVAVELSRIVAPPKALPREDGNPFPFAIA